MKIMEMFGGVPVEFGGKPAGGAAKVVWEISQELAKTYDVYMYPLHEYPKRMLKGVKVIARSKLNIIARNFPTPRCGVKYYKFLKKFGFSKKNALRFALSNCAQEKYLKKVVGRVKPDIIHIHGLSADRLFAINFSLRSNLRVTLTLHGLIGFSPNLVDNSVPYELTSRRRYERRILTDVVNNKGLVTTVSSRIKEMALKAYSLPEERLSVVINGISESFFYPSVKNKRDLRSRYDIPNKTVFLTVGNLSKLKNQILVLETLLSLPNEFRGEMSYIIVGDGPMKKYLKKFATKHGLENVVLFKGFVSGQDLVDIYWASDYFILTSTSEAFGLVFLEAMAAGLPIITIKTLEGIGDIYNEDAFILAESYEVSEIASKIMETIDRTWNRKKISEHARKFLWRNIVKEYVKVFNKFRLGW